MDVVQSRTLSIKRNVRTLEPIPFDQEITLHIPTGLWRDLRKFRPDVIISHELGVRSLIASTYCRAHQIPLVIWAYQSRVSGGQGGALKRRIRQALLHQARSVVGMGVQAKEVLRSLGVEDERIISPLNAADHPALLSRHKTSISRQRADEIKHRLAGGKHLALVVGRLVPLKGTNTLLDTWAKLPDHVRSEWRLVFLGRGPLDRLVDAAKGMGVIRAGTSDTSEMSDWYGASDLHIFPTLGDVWGLVVNEAMACGVPTLCSIHAGCYDDLIVEGVTGMGYDPTHPQAVTRLKDALTDPSLKTIGESGRDAIASVTLDRLADGFRQAVSMACPQIM